MPSKTKAATCCPEAFYLQYLGVAVMIVLLCYQCSTEQLYLGTPATCLPLFDFTFTSALSVKLVFKVLNVLQHQEIHITKICRAWGFLCHSNFTVGHSGIDHLQGANNCSIVTTLCRDILRIWRWHNNSSHLETSENILNIPLCFCRSFNFMMHLTYLSQSIFILSTNFCSSPSG